MLHNTDEQTLKLLGRSELTRIAQTLFDLQQGGGGFRVEFLGWWNGELRWARNRISLASDRRDIFLKLTRDIERGGQGTAIINQIDHESLRAAMQAAERTANLQHYQDEPERFKIAPPDFATPVTTIWSNVTFGTTAETRNQVAQLLLTDAEPQGLLAAGYLETRGSEHFFAYAESAEQGLKLWYQQATQAQCSMTVRHPKGTGSGWAGNSSYDWQAIDSTAIAARALQKCAASLNPVRIEPGRYTAILEPQALGDLVIKLQEIGFNRGALPNNSESSTGTFLLGWDDGLQLYRSKLGLQVTDSRISIWHDVNDPQTGVIPHPGLRSVRLIDKGILTDLYNAENQGSRRFYPLPELNENEFMMPRPSLRMSGGETSLDEMIESTKRGLLVSRFSGLDVLDFSSALCTGYTRDGLWLIEDGKISKAVHNMRIAESPLFVLNQVDQLGVPVPIFYPSKYPEYSNLSPIIVPPIKVRDFSFTALSDAV